MFFRCGRAVQQFYQGIEKLYLSQPTISSHIQKLEEELGKRLILRTTKSLEVTPIGQAVYRRGVDIMALQQQIVELCSHNNQKVIRLGASTIPSAYVLPQLLPEFGQLHPEVCFTVQQTNSQGVADGLQEAVKNLVAGGMGISLISERAVQNFVAEKRVIKFELPECDVRSLYLAHRREYILPAHVKDFLAFARKKYRDAQSRTDLE